MSLRDNTNRLSRPLGIGQVRRRFYQAAALAAFAVFVGFALSGCGDRSVEAESVVSLSAKGDVA